MTGDDSGGSRENATTGREFSNPYAVKENVTVEPTLHISQEVFPLTEADFLRLKHRWAEPSLWASGLLLVGVGMLFVPAAKALQGSLFGSQVEVEAWEWAAPAIAIAIAGLVFIIGRLWPEERRKMIEDMESHFSEAPRIRRVEGPRE